ncbi:MAG TPA: cytochrome c oxidase assembly protein [Solirubrobacterales bacterium]|nr:cytochrome c oxidase assembly protein [Solirubrobacterales bacterium]
MTPPFAHVTGVYGLLELLPLFLAAGLYAKRSSTLTARGRPVPLWRQICFGGGLLLIAAAVAAPVSEAAEELVIAHMIEHLMLGDVASLLLVLG